MLSMNLYPKGVNQVLDLFSACMGPVPIDRSVHADS